MNKEILREVLSTFPSGVVIVTAVGGGDLFGMTASSFCSVSADPPLVSVCINEKSSTLAAIRCSNGFAINILSGTCESVARTFASSGVDKFEGEVTEPCGRGILLPEHTASYLACDLHMEVPAGDHSIVIGSVQQADYIHDNTLLFHRRQFSACSPSD